MYNKAERYKFLFYVQVFWIESQKNSMLREILSYHDNFLWCFLTRTISLKALLYKNIFIKIKMVKKAFLLAATALCFSWNVKAQKQCYTDEMHKEYAKANPQINIDDAQLNAAIDAMLNKKNFKNFKTTGSDVGLYDTQMLYVPIVFHIVHDYGSIEYITDEAVYSTLKTINDMYNLRFADTNNLIPPYNGFIPGTGVRYKANARITFVLPTKDPNGNPTHGITRKWSYLAYNAGDQAKMDVWAPDRYMNVWLVRNFNKNKDGVAAYALKPSAANASPWYDGVIGTSQMNDFNYDNTLSHELGHTLNLDHPWGATNNPKVACGDDDVDDTPPTKGHTSMNCNNIPPLCDTVCAMGYHKTYSPTLAHTLFGLNDTTVVDINYPDTVNAQNVMDYTYCSKMFSYLQAVRMRATLRLPTAGRSNLCSPSTLDFTGALLPRVDIAPIADFSIDHNTSLNNMSDMGFNMNVFTCTNATIYPTIFKNYSWNDTITNYSWTFKNGSSTTTSTSANVSKTFTESGWVDASLAVTGNHTGTSTIEKKNVAYVSDGVAVNANGYLQDFMTDDTAKYPKFNFFNNDHKWEIDDSVGLYDHTCIKYANFDDRTYPSYLTNSPVGDYDDFYTVPFDLTTMTGNVYLNFFSAGAFVTNNPNEMGDTLQISYSTNCGSSWINLKKFTRSEISNNGTQLTPFKPSGFWNWQPQSVLLPTAVKNSNKVFFRFRYRVGGDTYFIQGTGNNFYLDRLHFSNYTAAISVPNYNADGIAIAPNPTTGSSFVIIKEAKDKTAQIVVTDLTGKVVYSTEASLNVGTTNRIEIPATAITVKGMYLVQITSETSKHTEKLVVY